MGGPAQRLWEPRPTLAGSLRGPYGRLYARLWGTRRCHSPPGPPARSYGRRERLPTLGRTAFGGTRRRRTSTPQHCRVPLRHVGAAARLPRSEWYTDTLESNKLTAVTAAPRMPPPSRPAGAAATPWGRIDEFAASPRGGARATPCGNSSAWRPWPPLWARMCQDGHQDGPAGRVRHRTISSASGWARPRRGCLRTRRLWPRSAACSHCRRARSRSS